MAKAKNPIPNNLHTLTPGLVVKGAAQAMEFYKKAFGAVESSRFPGPNGLIMHASMRIGDSVFHLNDEMPGADATVPPSKLGGSTVTLSLYVEDCDKTYNQAVSAGAKPTLPLADQFWGDRWGLVTDPYGHVWSIGTHKEDLTPAEMEERGRQFFASVQHR